MTTLRGAVPAFVMLAMAGGADACTLPAGWTVVGDASAPARLAWRAEPVRPIAAGQPFVIAVQVCPAGALLQAVDATMPEHRHGMNYAPRLQAQGRGRWRVDGLLWHMSGRWELRFDVRAGDVVLALRHGVDLP